MYADTTLRNQDRKLSPIGTRALILYRDVCSSLLNYDGRDGTDDEELQVIRGEWIATIRMYEQSIQFTSCLKATRSTDAQMHQDQLLNLQRTSSYASYGDIFATACLKLRKEAEACEVAGWQTLQKGYWTDVNRKLVIERPAYERVLKGGNAHEECPTHIAVAQACTRFGFDLDDMLSIIHHYAVRNELLTARHPLPYDQARQLSRSDKNFA